MPFQDFLDRNGVIGIDPIFSEVMDESQQPLVIASFVSIPPSVPGLGMPPVPIEPASFGQAAGSAMMAKNPGSTPADVAGLNALMLLVAADINALIHPFLIAGATSLNLKPAPGPPAPAAPITPAALGAPPAPPDPNARKFAKAVLEWAVSFITPDGRLAGPITVLPL